MSLLEVGTWLGKSQTKFTVENLGKGAPDAPGVCWSTLTRLTHSALSASGEERPVLPEACLEAPDAKRASSGHRPVLGRFAELSVFKTGGHRTRLVTT